MRFQNKIILVTGAASGIGAATAVKFSEEGAHVVLSDITNLEHMKEKIHRTEEHLYLECDISNRESVIKMIKSAVTQYGSIDAAVNCAGIAGTVSKPIHLYPEADWLHQINVNLIGTYYCVKYQLEQMVSQGKGNIVCISSAAGLVGQPENSPYATSKHGINGLVKTAAIEYATQNIRVNAICPTAIDTPMIMHGRRNLAQNEAALAEAKNMQRMKRMGRPEEVADIALWLCSEQSSFITGHCIAADGGAFA